jgi:2-keto-3-deoxy-L-rhamnonate aldolase RhmA
MGIPGQWSHRKVKDAYARVGAACKKNGKFLGMGGIGDDKWAPHYIREGGHFVLAHSDHGMIMDSGSRRAAFLRKIEQPAAAAKRGKA